MIKLKYPLILASESPRRKQLLTEAGFSFTVFPVKVSENLKKNLNLDAALIEIAKEKAIASINEHNLLNTQNFLVLSADTMVIHEDRPLGKPKSRQDAVQMLGRLSGNKHEVKTAIFLIESLSKKFACDVVTTEVCFRPILRQEIEEYVASGEPMDKAGAYGIQGQGGRFVEKYEGPYDNVVGLPITELKKILELNHWMKE